MTLTIGDIHGCLTALETLLDRVQPSSEDLIITLGDYIDRGPNSAGVIDRLLKLKESHHYLHLMGNHEIQLIRALEAPHHQERFLSDLCGGKTTLENYGGKFEGIPKSHWNFIRNAKLYHETESHIFVHAGVNPDLPLEKQNAETLYYQRFNQAKPHQSGKPYICGHTIQGDLPTHLGFAVCLDTCAYGGGWLTALDTDSGRCWQSNESGDFREIELRQG